MGSVWVVVLGPEIEPAKMRHPALLNLVLVLFDTMFLRFSSYREEVKEAAQKTNQW